LGDNNYPVALKQINNFVIDPNINPQLINITTSKNPTISAKSGNVTITKSASKGSGSVTNKISS
jgi:uncharacterized membrane protein